MKNVATQNSNESFNSLIWSMARKDKHNSPIQTHLALNLAVSIYNDGFLRTMESILRRVGITATQNMRRSFKGIDKTRVKNSELKCQEKTKNRRKEIRRLKYQREAAFKHVEGVQYKSNSFHEGDAGTGSAAPKKRKVKQRSSCSKCGSDTHQRSNSKLCPMNKKRDAIQK